MTRTVLVLDVDLAAHPHGDADHHGGNGDAGDEGDAHGCAHQRAQLPEDLFLAAPRLLAPERAARRATTPAQATCTPASRTYTHTRTYMYMYVYIYCTRTRTCI